MESETTFKFNGDEYKGVFMTGYDNHHYCTVYNNANGQYLGQVKDIYASDKDAISRLKKFIELEAV